LTPLILGLLACRAAPFSTQGLEPLVCGLKLGLKLGWIPPGVACEHRLVFCHNLVSMMPDRADGRLDPPRAEVKKGGNLVAVPSRFIIIENIVNGDS